MLASSWQAKYAYLSGYQKGKTNPHEPLIINLKLKERSDKVRYEAHGCGDYKLNYILI